MLCERPRRPNHIKGISGKRSGFVRGGWKRRGRTEKPLWEARKRLGTLKLCCESTVKSIVKVVWKSPGAPNNGTDSTRRVWMSTILSGTRLVYCKYLVRTTDPKCVNCTLNETLFDKYLWWKMFMLKWVYIVIFARMHVISKDDFSFRTRFKLTLMIMPTGRNSTSLFLK